MAKVFFLNSILNFFGGGTALAAMPGRGTSSGGADRPSHSAAVADSRCRRAAVLHRAARQNPLPFPSGVRFFYLEIIWMLRWQPAAATLVRGWATAVPVAGGGRPEGRPERGGPRGGWPARGWGSSRSNRQNAARRVGIRMRRLCCPSLGFSRVFPRGARTPLHLGLSLFSPRGTK